MCEEGEWQKRKEMGGVGGEEEDCVGCVLLMGRDEM
jgi:hypothetical protein